ncbi:MAG: hypothetical protein KGI25_00570 [Thaumarchaeota archaeon]|nr:hypothetical protein [Nitrososphaerota archaeon]
MLDDNLGKVRWKITTREKVVMITIFQKNGILILSKDSNGDSEKIIQKILKLKF